MEKYSYFLYLSEKDINSIIYDLGTDYDRVWEHGLHDCLVSDRFPIPEKLVSFEAFCFLRDIAFIDYDSKSLSEEGKNYFKIAFILSDNEKAMELIREKLIVNPVVNLIGQVFFGRGKISKKQILNLLKYHNVIDYSISEDDLGRFLIFLNRYSIITYSKKTGAIYVPEPIKTDELVKQYFIEPSTPYSNIYNFRKIFRNLNGQLYWLDKHFRKEAFEIIVDNLSGEKIKSLTIISTSDNLTESAKNEYYMLKNELINRQIVLQWMIIKDTSFTSTWHDRWLISDNLCFNIPPVLSIIRGQLSEMIQTQNRPNIDNFLKSAITIETS